MINGILSDTVMLKIVSQRNSELKRTLFIDV
jgi:hypothetical protein